MIYAMRKFEMDANLVDLPPGSKVTSVEWMPKGEITALNPIQKRSVMDFVESDEWTVNIIALVPIKE